MQVTMYRDKDTRKAHRYTTKREGERIALHMKATIQGSLWFLKSTFKKPPPKIEVTITYEERE